MARLNLDGLEVEITVAACAPNCICQFADPTMKHTTIYANLNARQRKKSVSDLKKTSTISSNNTLKTKILQFLKWCFRFDSVMRRGMSMLQL